MRLPPICLCLQHAALSPAVGGRRVAAELPTTCTTVSPLPTTCTTVGGRRAATKPGGAGASLVLSLRAHSTTCCNFCFPLRASQWAAGASRQNLEELALLAASAASQHNLLQLLLPFPAPTVGGRCVAAELGGAGTLGPRNGAGRRHRAAFEGKNCFFCRPELQLQPCTPCQFERHWNPSVVCCSVPLRLLCLWLWPAAACGAAGAPADTCRFKCALCRPPWRSAWWPL